jgi:hypothetical protein
MLGHGMLWVFFVSRQVSHRKWNIRSFRCIHSGKADLAVRVVLMACGVYDIALMLKPEHSASIASP